MEIETYLYPYSANEARKRGELALWRASHQANISCKRAIEESIRQNFDGMRLNNGCVDEVIAKYGYKGPRGYCQTRSSKRIRMAASAKRISNGPRELAFPQITGTTAIL